MFKCTHTQSIQLCLYCISLFVGMFLEACDPQRPFDYGQSPEHHRLQTAMYQRNGPGGLGYTKTFLTFQSVQKSQD